LVEDHRELVQSLHDFVIICHGVPWTHICGGIDFACEEHFLVYVFFADFMHFCKLHNHGDGEAETKVA
jgi:hypothetical protein